MLALNLPHSQLKIGIQNQKKVVFDILRNKYVALTPEEWVRQNFIHFLIKYKGYPQALMANEVCLKLNGMSRRCDTILYDKNISPKMIIEYKAPTIEITQKTFAQICRYNLVLKVDYLIVSNGIRHFCCQMDYKNQTYAFLTEIPDYKKLCKYDGIEYSLEH